MSKATEAAKRAEEAAKAAVRDQADDKPLGYTVLVASIGVALGFLVGLMLGLQF